MQQDYGTMREVLKVTNKRTLNRLAIATVLAGLSAVAAVSSADPLSAQGWQRTRQEPVAQSRAHGQPLLAVVALGQQRITIYDAAGKILQAPVSTGSSGFETPAGIFSVVQKKLDHASNLYEDGDMPFMQRITWTGIALHAGALPGRPASHGCVRLPRPFAERLFSLTDLGMRVVIVRDDIAPAAISHPALPRSTGAGSPKHLIAVRSAATGKAEQASTAAKRAQEAKRATAKKTAEAGTAAKVVRLAEGNLAKARERLKAAERALDAAAAAAPQQGSPASLANKSQKKIEAARKRLEKAGQKISEIEAWLEAVRAQAQAKAEAAKRALEDAKAAEAAKDAAADSAEKAKRKGQPVSLFISRKTRRYYIRQGFEPVHEGPVTIHDPDRPIGTYVFTAVSYADGPWNVVSMYGDDGAVQPVADRHRTSLATGAAPADVAGAEAALDRIVLPPAALQRIPEIVLPGSSLVVSDEGPSIETGKDTDFVVVMSGEPQGALKIRKREPMRQFGDDDFFGSSPYRGSSYRSRYRGFPFFN
jgi:hypothetical protein